MGYYNSPECKELLNALYVNKTFKNRKNLFTSETEYKNTIILRHYFTRLRETFGVFDGFRSGKNYTQKGKPHQLKYGHMESYDLHVMKWQKELLDEGLIKEDHILSPGSIVMMVNWTLTKQLASYEKFDLNRVALGRTAASAAYWLLPADRNLLEEFNFGKIVS